MPPSRSSVDIGGISPGKRRACSGRPGDAGIPFSGAHPIARLAECQLHASPEPGARARARVADDRDSAQVTLNRRSTSIVRPRRRLITTLDLYPPGSTVLVPKLVTTLKGYSGSDFASDLIAGIIVGIVALPLAIAFAIA